jgi:hypothetical protein
VAAELGAIGFVFYLAFLAATVRAAFLAMQRRQAVGLALLAAFTVLVVHSLFYSGFFEDPYTWGIVGLAAACLSLAPSTSPATAGQQAPATRAAGGAASRGASA